MLDPQTDSKFIRHLQRRVAEVAIDASTLRNQGAPGVVRAARNALAAADLKRLVASSEQAFRIELNRLTQRVRRRLPRSASRWGTARKAVNIFLRDALYNTYLAEALKLQAIEPWLELPLDKYTVEALKREYRRSNLPEWPGVAAVGPRLYAQYQSAASEVASVRALRARVHLDVLWWRVRSSTAET